MRKLRQGCQNNLLIPTTNLILIIVEITVSSTKNFEEWCQDIYSGSRSSWAYALILSTSLPACTAGEQCNNVCPSAFRVACFQMILLSLWESLQARVNILPTIYIHSIFYMTKASSNLSIHPLFVVRRHTTRLSKWYASPF